MILKFDCVTESTAYRVRGAQHRGMPQFRNSDDKIGPAVAGPPTIQFAACGGGREAISANTDLDEPDIAANTRAIFPLRSEIAVAQ